MSMPRGHFRTLHNEYRTPSASSLSRRRQDELLLLVLMMMLLLLLFQPCLMKKMSLRWSPSLAARKF